MSFVGGIVIVCYHYKITTKTVDKRLKRCVKLLKLTVLTAENVRKPSSVRKKKRLSNTLTLLLRSRKA